MLSLFIQLGWFFRANRGKYFLALCILTLVALTSLSIPWLVGLAVDQLIQTDELNRQQFYQVLILIVVVAGLMYGFRYVWRIVLFNTSYQLGQQLRSALFKRLSSQGLGFYNRFSTGDLMARATNDIDAIETAAGEGVLSGFSGILTLSVVLIMMFVAIDWRLSVIALLPFPALAYGFYRMSRRIHHEFNDALQQFSALNQKVQESLAGIRLVKAMGIASLESSSFASIAEKARSSSFNVAKTEALYQPAVRLATSLAYGLAISCGGYWVWKGEISIGDLTAFTLYMSHLIWPLWAFGWLMNLNERGSAAYKRVAAILEEPDSIPNQGILTPELSEIRVTNLNYRYPNQDHITLAGIDLRFKPGEVIGITGPTGSGKSTLLKLLMRQWESQSGEIAFADTSIQDIELSHYRQQFAYVPQDPFLFSMSVADNIALAKPEATKSEIEHVAKLACVHDDIVSFPNGYDTLVGERGLTLSGGQRQRISIARALLTNASILVLDDALSAVDVTTEQHILSHLQQALTTLEQTQMCIMVSHRLSSIRHADQIVVLKNGQTLGKGTHTELLTQCRWYQRMSEYQQLEKALSC